LAGQRNRTQTETRNGAPRGTQAKDTRKHNRVMPLRASKVFSASSGDIPPMAKSMSGARLELRPFACGRVPGGLAVVPRGGEGGGLRPSDPVGDGPRTPLGEGSTSTLAVSPGVPSTGQLARSAFDRPVETRSESAWKRMLEGLRQRSSEGGAGRAARSRSDPRLRLRATAHWRLEEHRDDPSRSIESANVVLPHRALAR